MTRYFHGGVPGLKSGDFILPPDETGAVSCADYGGAVAFCSRSHVYLSVDFDDAVLYAAMHPSNKGMVYEVEPEGELLPDLDCNVPGKSFMAKRAKIIHAGKIKNKTRFKIQRILLGRR